MKMSWLFVVLLMLGISSFAQDKKFYPCTLITANGQYTIQIPNDISLHFKKTWDEFHYSGNGYTWEGLLKQFIRKDKFTIDVEFDSEGGEFWASLKTRADQLKFAQYIHELCANKNKFREYVKNADRSSVDD
jgi:hypothetical protein